MAMNMLKEMNWREGAIRLAIELLVVFVGVYAAFTLSEYQAATKASERRNQIQAALVREIKDITSNTRNAVMVFARMESFYDSALAAKGLPLPAPVMEPVRLRNHMWEAVLTSGGLDLLDVATVYKLSDFYNELNGGLAQLEHLRQLSQSLLVPNLARGADAFYERPGRLRATYSWYLPTIRKLHFVAERITSKGDKLVEELGEAR